MRTNPLLDPFLERDTDAIRAAMRELARERGPEELFGEVARLTVLSYAPAQHAKHALIACAAAWEVRDALGDRWIDLLTECAIYASDSRQPWSEPPILEPPPVESSQRRGVDELRAAAADHDRLRGERWLSARLEDEDLARDYFLVACDDFEDLGHKLIVATAAWKLAAVLDPAARFAVLRTGIWEMVAYGAASYGERGDAPDPAALMDRLVSVAVADGGSLIAMHSLFLLDAAAEAAQIAGERRIRERVCDYLAAEAGPMSQDAAPADVPQLAPYRLARDYAGFLKMHAVAGRWRATSPPVDAAVVAAKQNLDNAPSFEEWTFA